MKSLVLMLVLASIFLSASQRLGAQEPAPDQPVPIFVAHTETLHSQLLGETRTLEIRLPPDYERSAASYPVLVALDGGVWFRYLVSILDMIAPNHLPDMIVVGLPNTDRGRDLDVVNTTLGEPGAGARRFQRFVSQELLPHLDHTYRTAPYRILAGHSLAGLATLNHLLLEPGVFQAYFASSPSLLSGGRGDVIRGMVAEVTPLQLANRFLFLSAGGMENPELPPALAEIGKELQDRSGGRLQAQWRVYEGEGHFPIKGYYDGFRTLFNGWFPTGETFLGGSWQGIRAHYGDLSSRFGFQVDPPFDVAASVANRLLRAGDTVAAVGIYRGMVEQFPGETLPLRRLRELDHSAFRGHYLGQSPPGVEARLFAGGELVQLPDGRRRSFNLAFSPDGTELFFSHAKGTDERPDPYYEIKEFRRDGDEWQGPFAAPFSGIHSDVDINYSPDGRFLFFASERPHPESGGMDIYYVERQGEGWSDPVHAGTRVNSQQGEVYPSLSDKGNLFFRSGRPGGQGGADIWRAEWKDGDFVNVRNLGPGVNTEHGESNSVIARDESYILFVSARPETGDQYYIFVSFQVGDNEWTPAVPLGPEVNTLAGAGAPTLSPDGRFLFFKRRDGPERGLYWISTQVIEALRPGR